VGSGSTVKFFSLNVFALAYRTPSPALAARRQTACVACSTVRRPRKTDMALAVG